MQITKRRMDRANRRPHVPMIDVTFLLMILFIETLNFRAREKEFEVYLPTESGQNSSDSS